MASKKGSSTAKNGRDSIGRRLGAKLGDGQFATSGSIIYRQRGTKIFPGLNAKRGSDDTIYAVVDGHVKYERSRNRKQASVYPTSEYLAKFFNDSTKK